MVVRPRLYTARFFSSEHDYRGDDGPNVQYVLGASRDENGAALRKDARLSCFPKTGLQPNRKPRTAGAPDPRSRWSIGTVAHDPSQPELCQFCPGSPGRKPMARRSVTAKTKATRKDKMASFRLAAGCLVKGRWKAFEHCVFVNIIEDFKQHQDQQRAALGNHRSLRVASTPMTTGG